MEIGKQIKILRMKKGVTQEELANYLGISYQAVSKWENDLTSPDIQLLPLLSIYFSITIDELFEIPNESHERIISLLKEEHNVFSGEMIDEPSREIERLQKLSKENKIK